MVAAMHYPPKHWGDALQMPLDQGVDEEIPDPITQVTVTPPMLFGIPRHPNHHTYLSYRMTGEEYAHFDLDPSNGKFPYALGKLLLRQTVLIGGLVDPPTGQAGTPA